MNWLVSSRIKFFDSMKNGKPTKYFAAHLPVMATWREGDPYPVNMTVKGLGLLPTEENLQYYTELFENIAAESRALPWGESLNKRMEAVKILYGDMENLDPTMLGGLEIFEGRAFENMQINPHTSLLYMGMSEAEQGMQYISFQINGEVEILSNDHPYYRYLLASRKLFEFEKFHLYQPDYPFGYLVKVAEVRDKSPWSKSQGPFRNNS